MTNDDARIRQIAQQEIQNAAGRSAYQVNNIPFHTHNGVDAPVVYSATQQYVGFVPSDGDVTGGSTNGYVFFPQGWRAERIGFPANILYKVYHNLNTDYYSLSLTPTGVDNSPGPAPGAILMPNEFWCTFRTEAGVSYPIDFSFILVTVNNSNQSIPQYTTRGGVVPT